MQATEFYSYLALKELEYEQICKRCGRCCGVANDPCENLIRIGDGKCLCRDYESHLGLHKTISGKPFNCMPIRDLVRQGAVPSGCAYVTTEGL